MSMYSSSRVTVIKSLTKVTTKSIIWNRVDCQRSEKRFKTRKRLKERFLIRRNRTKRAHFWGKPLFQATYNIKTEEKKKKKKNQLILRQLDVGGWRKEKGTRLTIIQLVLCQLDVGGWWKLEKEDFLKNVHVLSCFIQLKSVLLISCVFWMFFQNAGSQLFQIFKNFHLLSVTRCIVCESLKRPSIAHIIETRKFLK